MKAIQYLMDSNGKPQAVQLPIAEWNRMVSRLKKYEEMLMLKSNLTTAFVQVKKMQQGNLKKQTLQDFLDEL